MAPTVDNFVQVMCDYQKAHNITNKCYVNSMYFLDSVKRGFPMARAVPVFCISGKRNIVHLVVMINDEIFEPSYDMENLPDKVYLQTVMELRQSFWATSNTEEVIIAHVRKFLELTEHAAQINLLKMMPSSKEDLLYYHAQADYCDEVFAPAAAASK